MALLKKCTVCKAIKDLNDFQLQTNHKPAARCKRCVSVNERLRESVTMLCMLEAINDVVYTTYTQAVKFKTIKEILRGKGYDGPYSDEMRSDRSPYQDIKLHNAGEDGG